MVRSEDVHGVSSLPYSTAECDEGPILEHRPGHVTLRYDANAANGIIWTVIEFRGAIALRFTPDPACEPWMLAAYSRISEARDSTWIEDLRASAQRQSTAFPASLRHFLLYFDHVGCWEVVAGGVDWRSNEEFPPP